MSPVASPAHVAAVEYDGTEGYRGSCTCGWTGRWLADMAAATQQAGGHLRDEGISQFGFSSETTT